MEEVVPIVTFKLLGFPVDITKVMVTQWVIIIIALILGVAYKFSMKKFPGKVQATVETAVIKVNHIVLENMGKGKEGFIPYIFALAIYVFSLNMVGLFGIKPPTSEISVTLGLASITFFVIQWYAIKKNGLGGYFKGYARPIPFLLPINIIERVMLPISLSLRLFGNIFAGTVIVELIYGALGKINFFATIGLPIPAHFYFDVFDAGIQTIIFVMLTMINIKITAEH
ncbi:MAG: F0F1 ATP synthase subunit A [Clostridium sp.]